MFNTLTLLYKYFLFVNSGLRNKKHNILFYSVGHVYYEVVGGSLNPKNNAQLVDSHIK